MRRHGHSAPMLAAEIPANSISHELVRAEREVALRVGLASHRRLDLQDEHSVGNCDAMQLSAQCAPATAAMRDPDTCAELIAAIASIGTVNSMSAAPRRQEPHMLCSEPVATQRPAAPANSMR